MYDVRALHMVRSDEQRALNIMISQTISTVGFGDW